MKRACFSAWTVVLLCVMFLSPAAKQSRAADDSGDFYPAKMNGGPYNVSVINLDWYDAGRERQVPIRMYFPADGQGPFPVIIFSHGLGGSREGYEYLGRHWASHGLVSVHVQHLGSDKAVWRLSLNPLRALKRAINPVNSYNRTLDVSFALDQLRELNQNDDLLQGRLDLDRVGVAGHSYGAFTGMLLAGQHSLDRDGLPGSLADSRIKAVVVMSPPVPEIKDMLEQVYADIKLPIMHLTGTKDQTIIHHTRATERRLAFDYINGRDQYFVNFIGGDHGVFSGRRHFWRDYGKDLLIQKLICLSTTTFWEGYLKNDSKVRDWLKNGGLAAMLADSGTLEIKTGLLVSGPIVE